MKHLLPLLLLLACAPAHAQEDCSEKVFNRLVAQARRFAEDGAYDKALDKLQSAKTCQPLREAEVNQEILHVFDLINGQRMLAIDQKLKAEKVGRASANLARALIVRDEDPTLALRILQYNIWRHQEDEVSSFTHYKMITAPRDQYPYYQERFNELSPEADFSFSGDGKWVIIQPITDITYERPTTFWSMDTRVLETETWTNVKAISYHTNWVVCESNGRLQLWQRQPKRLLRESEPLGGNVLSAQFNSDSTWLYVRVTDGTWESIFTWGLTDGSLHHTPACPVTALNNDATWALRLEHEEDNLALRRYCCDAGRLIPEDKIGVEVEDSDPWKEFHLSPNGKWAVLEGSNRDLLVGFEPDTIVEMNELGVYQYSPDGQTLSYMHEEDDDSYSIVFRNLQTGMERGVSGEGVAAFSKNGKTVLIQTASGTELLGMTTLNTLREFPGSPRDLSADGVWALIIQYTEDGFGTVLKAYVEICAINPPDNTDTNSAETLHSISPDNRWVVTHNYRYVGALWSLESHNMLNVNLDYDWIIRFPPFTPEGYLLRDGDSMHVRAYALDTSVLELDTTRFIRLLPKFPIGYDVKHNRMLVNQSGRLQIWNYDPAEPGLVLQGRHVGAIKAVFLENSDKVITISDDSLMVWSSSSGQHFRTFGGASFVYSADGRWIMEKGSEQARLWSVEQNKLVHRIRGELHRPAFSPDGNYFLSLNEKSVAIWSTTGGNIVRTLPGHRGEVKQAIFSPDSRYVLSYGDDQTLRLWQVADGSPVKTFYVDNKDVSLDDLQFSPDGHWILANGSNPFDNFDTTYRWNLDTDCAECPLRDFSLEELHAEGLQPEPVDLLRLWNQGVDLTPQELEWIGKKGNK